MLDLMRSFARRHGLTLLLLFAIAFILHVRFGMAAWNDERAVRHQQPVGTVA